MARRIMITKRATIERNYRCERCGAFGVVTLRCIGQSGWRREGWFNRDTVEANAREDAGWDLQHDADRIMALMRCPTCREQAPRARFWSVVRGVPMGLLGMFMAGTVGTIAILFLHLPYWISIPLSPVGIWFGVSDERRRWREAKGAVVRGLVSGQAKLPTAVARIAPAAPPAPTPKVEPLRTSAPEVVAHASDAEGPRFLRES